MNRTFFAIFGVALILGTVHAQQDGPPIDAAALLQKLEQLEQRQLQAEQAALQSALSQIKAATANGQAAVRFFVEATEAVQFEGTKGKGAAMAAWKERRSDFLRAKPTQTILLLHLRYLGLSLERKASDKPEIFVQPSLAYANDLVATDQLFTGLDKETQDLKKKLLDEPLTQGIFVKWLKLAPFLPGADQWELVPGNLSGILEKNVRSALREAASPQLIDTWDFEVNVRATRASSSRPEFEIAEFNTVTRPRLQFSRANDMARIGMTNRAINEMIKLAQEYPQHPDFKNWATRIRQLVAPAPES